MKTPAYFLWAASAIFVATMAGCASSVPQQSGQWLDPALGTSSALMRSDKVLVACEAWDLTMRQNCQDSLYREVQGRGGQALMSRSASLVSGRELDSQLAAEALDAGAKSVMVVTLAPVVTGGSGFSGASIGLGGYSWGRGGGAGVGIGLPIGGGGWGSMGVSAQGRLTDVTQSRLVWTTTFVSSSSGDSMSQVVELTRAVATAAQGAGLL